MPNLYITHLKITGCSTETDCTFPNNMIKGILGTVDHFLPRFYRTVCKHPFFVIIAMKTNFVTTTVNMLYHIRITASNLAWNKIGTWNLHLIR